MNNFILKYIPRFFILILLIGLLDSCKPKKEIIPTSDLPLVSAKTLVTSMHENQADFEFLSTRFAASALIDNQNYNVSGNIRIDKDKAIFISVSPFLGVELLRALITPDTVKILNRMESSYFIGDMQYINKLLNTDLDFYMLQAILTGNDFEHFNTNNFQVLDDRGKLLLHSPSRKNEEKIASINYEHNIWLNKSSHKIEQTVLYDPTTRRTIRAAYSDFSTISGERLPTRIDLEFIEPSSKTELSLTYNKTDLNNPRPVSFSIPEKYVPMDL